MAIEFKCSGCDSVLRVPDEHLGKQARCPKCQTLNFIQPAAPEAESAYSHGYDPYSSDSANPFADPSPDIEFSGAGLDDDFAKTSSNPYHPTAATAAPARGHRLAHRGGVILTLGILSVVCNMCLIPGIMAWVMGSADLQQMRSGRMNPEGRGLTQTGMILGIIMTCVSGLIFLLSMLRAALNI